MRVVRLLAVVLACAFAAPAHATSWSTDISDLWWVPTESGWGMQIVQTYDQSFVTIYVYRPDRTPVWYSALIKGPIANMTGDLYETRGGYFGDEFSFILAPTTNRKVGTLTFSHINQFAATVTYSVDGVNVRKRIERQPVGVENHAGVFRGGASVMRVSGTCAPFPLGRGQVGEVEIVQPNRGTAMAVTLRIGTESCSMPLGDYIQNGRFGDVEGAAQCANGTSGSLYVYEMRTSFDTLTARFEYENVLTGCKLDGDFAGVRM